MSQKGSKLILLCWWWAGADNVSYVSGIPEEKDWLAIWVVSWAAPRTAWSCYLIPWQCKGRNMHEHRRKPQTVRESRDFCCCSVFCFVVGFLFVLFQFCFIFLVVVFCLVLLWDFLCCFYFFNFCCCFALFKAVLQLFLWLLLWSLPLLRWQDMNRRNWKKGQKSEVALLEKVCMSWESCAPLPQGVGEEPWSNAQKRWRNFANKVKSQLCVNLWSAQRLVNKAQVFCKSILPASSNLAVNPYPCLAGVHYKGAQWAGWALDSFGGWLVFHHPTDCCLCQEQKIFCFLGYVLIWQTHFGKMKHTLLLLGWWHSATLNV